MTTYRGFEIHTTYDEVVKMFKAEAFNKAGIIKIGYGSNKEGAVDDVKDLISEFLDITDLD